VRALIVAAAFLIALRAESASAQAPPPGFATVAESAVLRLHVNPANGQIVVDDKLGGRRWESNLPGGHPAVVAVLYTDDRRSQSRYVDTSSGKPVVTFARTADGATVDYAFDEAQLGRRLVYRLADDYLDVELPESSLREEGKNVFARIDPLPSFGAAKADAEGYFVVPNGVGALVRFGQSQPDYRRDYEAEVYGPATLAFGPGTGAEERAAMPVYGIVDGDAAMLAVIRRGEMDAQLAAQMATRPAELNRVGAQFLVRRTALYPRRRGTFAARVETDPVRSERAIRFRFLRGPDATYVGLAKAYREHLIAERGARPLAGDEAPLHLRLFMGVERSSFPWPELVKLTTFDQAIEILEALAARGVGRLHVTLVGWEKGGAFGRWPIRLPPEAGFGGETGLRRLAQYCLANGHRLIVEDQYLFGIDRNGGFSTRADVVKAANRLAMTNQAERVFLLNPVFARQRYAEPDTAALARWGVGGVLVRYAGETVLRDHNETNPLDRAAFAEQQRGLLRLARERTGWAGAEGANDYLVGAADHLDKVPLDRWNYQFFEETVPFLPIALHGLVTYSAIPGNIRGDATRERLRAIEYGVLPSFELTYEAPLELARTEYDGLFSSRYTDWLDQVVDEYRLARDELGAAWRLPIADHRRIGGEQFETTYADGTRVTVDYRGAGSYRVERGG
jgi:hypothetical protein